MIPRLALSLALLASCARSSAPPRYPGLAAAVARGEAPNTTSVLVMRGGKVDHEAYFGGSGPDALQDTRSVGKSITALAVGIAIGQGAIPSVSAPAFRYLAGGVPAQDGITIEDLLTMSSALDCDDNDQASPGNEAKMYPQPVWLPWAARLGIRNDYRRDATGRGPWRYCTAGSFLLGQVVQAATKQPVDQFIADRLLRPLQIERWRFSRSPAGEVMTGGQLLLRSRDLAALGWLVRSEGQWQGREIVPAAFVRQALTPHRQTPYFEEAYGYQLWRHRYAAPCGPVTAWQMSGNGGNKVVIAEQLDAVIVLTRAHYNKRGMHEQSAALIEQHILPELCRSRS